MQQKTALFYWVQAPERVLMARFTTLYSGSSGNSAVAESNGRFLLLDMGGSCKATVQSLQEVGLSPQGLDGILISHEHSDHIKGLKVFLKKFPVPVYASAATVSALWRMDAVPPSADLFIMEEETQQVGSFMVEGFNLPHDAAGCMGFTIQTQESCMTIATDLGFLHPSVFKKMQKSSLVALESNYDSHMLRTGPYPYALKRRIESERGHLPNHEASQAVVSLVASGCRRIALCHLSNENNSPYLVKQAMDQAFFAAGQRPPEDLILQVAPRYKPGVWMDF